MRIFKYKSFDRWASSEKLSDKILQKALIEMNNGLYEADLGSGLYKKRIALQGKGKRGGYRTLIAFQCEEKAFFLFGFSKNECENISDNEKKIYKKLAKDLLGLDEKAIKTLIDMGKFIEVI